MQSRVLIADDRPRSRSGLRAVLDLRPETVLVAERRRPEGATTGGEAPTLWLWSNRTGRNRIVSPFRVVWRVRYP
jgi:hypothetical protein